MARYGSYNLLGGANLVSANHDAPDLDGGLNEHVKLDQPVAAIYVVSLCRLLYINHGPFTCVLDGLTPKYPFGHASHIIGNLWGPLVHPVDQHIPTFISSR